MALAHAIDGAQSGLVILDDHGELFFHSSPDGADLIALVDSVCSAAERSAAIDSDLVVLDAARSQ